MSMSFNQVCDAKKELKRLRSEASRLRFNGKEPEAVVLEAKAGVIARKILEAGWKKP